MGNRNFFLFICCSCAVVLVGGCSSSEYNRAMGSARTQIPEIQQFHELFPDATSFISYSTGENGTPTWNSKAGLYGRYVLQMQVKIHFSPDRTKVLDYQESTFYLTDVEGLQPGRLEGVVGAKDDTHRSFGPEQWAKVVKAKGDLSKVFPGIKKENPLKAFERTLKSF